MADDVARTEAEEAAEVPYDASDPQQVNVARKRSGRRRRTRLEFVKAMMDIPAGRAWMYEQLERCHTFHTSFVQGDPHATSFREGERNAGLRLLADVMAAAPDQYVTMIKEGKSSHG